MEYELDTRDFALVVLPHLDYDSQIIAIKNLLKSHKEAEKITRKDIDSITVSIKHYGKQLDMYFDYLQDERSELIQSSIYQDAAHSMAAVAMLAPFTESLFHQTFLGIQKQFYPEIYQLLKHDRFAEVVNRSWDCHFVWSCSKKDWIGNLERGIAQLSDATNLKDFLPADLNKMLHALFSYRNKMMHCGFEWPIDEREKFDQRIKDGQLPQEWFSSAKSGGNSWIFYLSDIFIEHCLNTIDSVINGIGIFIKNRIDTLSEAK